VALRGVRARGDLLTTVPGVAVPTGGSEGGDRAAVRGGVTGATGAAAVGASGECACRGANEENGAEEEE